MKMRYRIINVSISFIIMLFFVFLFFTKSKNTEYKCQGSINASISHSDVHLDAHITQIYSNGSFDIPYTVIGSIRKGDDTYVLFRDGNFHLSKNRIMRKITNENINAPDNVEHNLWEDNFLTRKYNVEFYQTEIELNEQLVFIRGLSGPLMICVKSPI